MTVPRSAIPRPRLEVERGAGYHRVRVVGLVAAAHAALTGGVLNRAVLRLLDRALPRRGVPAVRVSVSPGVNLRLHGGGALARMAVVGAGYEHAEGEVLTGATQPGGVFVDVGANVGWFSLLVGAHRPAGEVWAFEPIDDTARHLERAVVASDLRNVLVYRIALGEHDSDAEFLVTPDSAFSHRAADGGTSCPVRTLDGIWRAAGGPRVDCVKIAVEGDEPAVLRGAREMIACWRPLLLVDTPTSERRAAVLAEVAGLGYREQECSGLLPYNTVLTVS
ncbi:[2-O-methyl-alpha-L-fucopyranosyl-(1-_3)-alpha-L- rhamnopyranosyl-(1-_3)-2-O-methyl-alpha-L-rhamnopyranosyl] dimycocerosyl phenol-phthiocerol 4'''-O-methyltransferase [Saccharothrix violaceirubra]|uniref:FkbM family methyltransferase n=1 Tax=Saccharothrix violaceirubra TaxID=413306 RepID=A0A7W7SYR3_9PSEU|nr:FkbM family methyltransferase [Saccharothrix violaceirubra]MBB4963368.1 FkbM family methyltransferase [Saccharothrix violaceirubra]